ncbi:alpha-1,4-N-acetylglucosaminyltransferase-like [Ambystoma mexicanum]|uniref:alpha-1,4-N-acetylglucosaminyltransferase-like n=1 Tax=Ambystoma mexicanum TaxID=8296 RepID=UPI0037E98A51
MLKASRIIIIFMSITTCTFLYRLAFKMDCFLCVPLPFRKPPSIDDVLRPGTGIIFLETSDCLEPRPLVSCALESAARIYPDRPVVFLMKGLVNHTKEEINSTHKAFTLLSSIGNVFMFPLNMEKLLNDTPLLPWYVKVNHTGEKHWLHISADASRLAIIWKYGGMYMDTDIISIRRIPVDDFVAAQHSTYSSNGIFSFKFHHKFILDCMENFVEKYNGKIWGHQGPDLFTRILRKRCKLPVFQEQEDGMCQNISFLNPQRFYPIGYPSWKRYYEVWKIDPTFNDSYALHLWNYMNNENKSVIPGSNTLVEHLYKTYCPTTYKVLINSTEEE